MQKEIDYQINAQKASHDLFNKTVVWLKNSNLSYHLTENYLTEENMVSYVLRTDDANLIAFLEQLSDYNERLEQRLHKL